MARTYLTGLVAICTELSKYVTKYGPVIVPLLESPEKEAFIALIAACQSFLQSGIVDQAKND